MRGAVLASSGAPRPYAESRPLQVLELPTPLPRPGEVRVRVTLASLCHSDLSVVDGSRPRPLPMLLGHEAVGVVDALGDGVDDLSIGDDVVLVFVPSCGDCRMCENGRPALCVRAASANAAGRLLHGASLLRDAAGAPIHHHLGVSAFAEYAVVARESLVAIDRDVPHEVAVMLGCAALTGMGAVLRTADVRPGQSVAVFGLGAVGLAAVMAARAAGATTIVAVDPNTSKHSIAVASGATAATTPDDLGAVLATAGLDAVDVAIEAAGSARVMEAALAVVDRGGALVCVGLPHPEQTITVQALQFAASGKRLLGSYMGDAVPADDIPRYLAWWRDGHLPLEALYSGTAPLADINESLDALADGRVVRRLIATGA
jgi:Zn-dependent alcohol dehydrogenase